MKTPLLWWSGIQKSNRHVYPSPDFNNSQHLPVSFRRFKIGVSQSVSSILLGLELLEICLRCIFLGCLPARPADPDISAARSSTSSCRHVCQASGWFSCTVKFENQGLRQVWQASCSHGISEGTTCQHHSQGFWSFTWRIQKDGPWACSLPAWLAHPFPLVGSCTC